MNSDIKTKFIYDSILYYAGKITGTAGKEFENIYIMKLADKISATFDRRKAPDSEFTFDESGNLYSIFNILNGNNESKRYDASVLYEDEKIKFAKDSADKPLVEFYKAIKEKLSGKLENASVDMDFINSYLEILERTTSYIPVSGSGDEKVDISVYEHIKQSIAIGSSLFEYLTENEKVKEQESIYHSPEEFYKEKSILLYSMDFSGIQSFIYGQYGKEEVLKNLRSRSFYLEILMENVIDELLKSLNLSVANLLYAGGGHAYFILANTQKTKTLLSDFDADIKAWMQDTFGIDLYIGSGYCECSCNDLQNKPDGAYSNCFREVSGAVSQNKLRRYGASQIKALNKGKKTDGERECKICHSSYNLNENGVCSLCDGFAKLSKDILNREIFTVVSDKESGILPIYKNGYLSGGNIKRKDGEEYLNTNKKILIRAYSKNGVYKGKDYVKTIYVGDYHNADTLENLVKDGVGIKRLGVLRGDIDNLGKAFVGGFEKSKQTLSKSAAFSRKLTQFFKYDINNILRNPVYKIPFSDGEAENTDRKIAIIYSGGDDVFVVGAWKDIIEFGIDLYNNLKEYTQGTLTVSAGLGIYMPKYPISYMAEKTGELEDYSKKLDGKNAVTLFDKNNSYHWDEFIDEVMGEKFATVSEFFSTVEDKGKSLLYNLLELFRNRDKKINIARMAYTLARMEPSGKVSEEEKTVYKKFKEKVYDWMFSESDTKQMITAIYIYSYLIRKEEEK
ncbi:type III-A CRISPR-associated protein Cas10/Csm1 [Lachnoanaerobaculum sp.]